MAVTPQHDPFKERYDFHRDLARTPLSQVQGLLDGTNILSPSEREAIERRRDLLMAEREESVMRYVNRSFEAFNQRADRAQAEADAINYELDRLIVETEDGKVDVEDFTRQYARLEHRLNKIQRGLSDFERQAESIGQKEDDPEAWMEDLERRFPQLRQGLFGSFGPTPEPTGGSAQTE